MTLDQMRYFLEAAKFEHVGKAARSVFISPSAISSAISALESSMGVELFERQGKNIRLTDQGRALKTRVERILDEVSSLESNLKKGEAAMSGTYRLGASPFLASRYLAAAWFSLQRAHPGLVGELSSLQTARLVTDLLAGSQDFALCFSPLRHPDLKQVDLYQGQLKIAVRKSHPVLKEKSPLKKLSGYPATLHKASPGVDICESHPVFDRYGIEPKVTCYFDSDGTAVESLESSDAWSLLPDVVLAAHRKTLISIALPKDWNAPYTISAVIRSHRESNLVLGALKVELAKRFP